MNRRYFLLSFLVGLFLSSDAPLAQVERVHASGAYVVECRDAEGNVRWAQRIDNVVTTVGKNFALDTYLEGSGYTVTGPYVGLISNTSFSAVSAADTMASHAGWLEAGSANGPTYSGTRKTAGWSAAASGSKSLASPVSFTMTSSGSVRGAFLLLGSGASSTIDNTSGTLYSAGTFAAGAQPVNNGDTVSVSYTGSL